jgi:hypothetical protein
MRKILDQLWRTNTRKALALFSCLALLYFATGGAFLHHHTAGSENGTPCHVCQALHMPALAAATARELPSTQQVGWHEVEPLHAAPQDSFSLHRASRAPPLA